MYALVLFVCYLSGGCDDLVVGIFDDEQICLSAMGEQKLRQGGCYPVEDFIDGFWIPAQKHSDF